MILVASSNGDVGIEAGMKILRAGGSALDAVEAATRKVEDNRSDHSVGTGGYPNLIGEVELDASIMEGATRRAGAVAAIKGYPNPISIARAVLEKLPQHLLLAGEGAERFAGEQGFAQANLLTEEAEAAWRERVVTVAGEEYSFSEGVLLKRNGNGKSACERVTEMAEAGKTSGTVNFLAMDDQGNIASAVSTSGWAFKYPGRVGDSPIIGAGNYCDNRFGACACTGMGEWSIRASTARTVVMSMQHGMTLLDACRFAMKDLRTAPLAAGVEPVMNLIAIDRQGRHTGFTTVPGRTYIWQTETMDTFDTSLRDVVLDHSPL